MHLLGPYDCLRHPFRFEPETESYGRWDHGLGPPNLLPLGWLSSHV